MGWTRGTGKYEFELRVDLTRLVDAIIKSLADKKLINKTRDGKPLADWELDDTELIISAFGRCRWKNYYCRATMLDPEEDETELFDTIDDADLSGIIKEVLEKITEPDINKAIDIRIDEESLEDDYDGDYL